MPSWPRVDILTWGSCPSSQAPELQGYDGADPGETLTTGDAAQVSSSDIRPSETNPALETANKQLITRTNHRRSDSSSSTTSSALLRSLTPIVLPWPSLSPFPPSLSNRFHTQLLNE